MIALGGRRPIATIVAVATVVATGSGCAATKELAAIRRVDFAYDRVSDPRVAGIPLARVSSYSDLGPVDLAGLALAVASEDVPLDLTVHVIGTNPPTNDVTARMTALDWSYLVDGNETVSGRLTEGVAFPPGEPQDVPVTVTLNLAEFFGSDGRALLETALVLAGRRTSTKQVTMRLTPTIETPLGPLRYPAPLTINLSAAAAR